MNQKVILRELDNVRKNSDSSLLSIGAEPWMRDDRAWFQKNPRCGFRLRAPYSGEPLVAGSRWLVVKRINKGFRSKRPWCWDNAGIDGLLDGDAEHRDLVLSMMFVALEANTYQSIAIMRARAEALLSLKTGTQ